MPEACVSASFTSVRPPHASSDSATRGGLGRPRLHTRRVQRARAMPAPERLQGRQITGLGPVRPTILSASDHISASLTDLCPMASRTTRSGGVSDIFWLGNRMRRENRTSAAPAGGPWTNRTTKSSLRGVWTDRTSCVIARCAVTARAEIPALGRGVGSLEQGPLRPARNPPAHKRGSSRTRP